MIDPHHIWNVIYVARSNRSRRVTSPNTALATQKWFWWLIRVTYETSFTLRGATRVTLQTHQVLRLLQNSEFKIWARNPWIASANIKTIRPWSDHDPRIYNPTIKPSSRTRRFGDLTRPILETILYWKIQHFARRLSPKISRNAAPATKSHTPPSPNTAPATQNESHDWSASHMKHLFSLCI